MLKPNHPQSKSLLILNASPSGAVGNCAELIKIAHKQLDSLFTVSTAHLADIKSFASMSEQLESADAFLFVTGTYWDSWGSPLQRFLEEVSCTEGTKVWLGKPAAVVVLMHSVGGKGVLSRLQGVLNTFGALIPPMSGLVYSVANHLALKGRQSKLTEDLWRLGDLDTLCHNLSEACVDGGKDWKSWAVDREGFAEVWLERFK